MSETKVAVLGAGLAKFTILNICSVQTPLFQEHLFTTYNCYNSQVSTGKCLLLPASLDLLGCFSACWKAAFGAIRQQLSAFFYRAHA